MKNLIKMMIGKIEANISAVIGTTIRNIGFSLLQRTRPVPFIVCALVVGPLMLLTNPQPAYACNYEPPDDYDANVHSPTSASITTTSATLGGSVSRGSHWDGCNMVSDVISYRYIDYGTSPGSYGSNVNITGNISGAYTISVTGLTPGTTYYFRARATTNYGSYTSGESSFTTTAPPDTTPPSTPGAMTTSWSGDHYINTSFTANTTGSTDNVGVTSYSLCRSTDNAGGCAVWVAQGIGTSYTVSGADLPSTGTFRYYSWYAYDAAGNQSGTTQEYVRMDGVAPTTPGDMTTSWTGDHYVTTNFTAGTSGSTDAGVGVSSYSLCRSNDNAGGCSVWVAQGIGASTAVSGSHLPSSGAYRYYYWYAYDAFGNQSANSNGVYVRMNAQIPISTPTFPSNGGTVNTAGAITFTTNAVSDGDGQTPQYYFRIATGSDGETGVVCNSGWQTSTSYSCDPGIGTFYWHVYTYDGISQTNPNYTWSFNKVLATQSALSISSSVTATIPAAIASLTSSGGSGGGAVTYALTSAGTAGCSVAGTTVSYTNAGTCTVTATKAADASYNATSSPTTTFTINPGATTILSTTTVISISESGATIGSTIISDAGVGVTTRGTCWGATSTTTNNCLAAGGTTMGIFTHVRTGMSASTTYYARAYVTNSNGTTYGTSTRFVTEGAIVMSSSTVTLVTGTQATLGGTTVSGVGITARGTCWGTSAAPTTNCSSAVGTAIGTPFSHTRSGMNPSTTYYARAYATNAHGTSYSSDVTFITAGLPSVSNPTVINVTGSTTYLGGSIDYSGIGSLSMAYDSSETSIHSLTTDIVNGVLYAGSGTGGIIYRCVLSTNCNESEDFTVAVDTIETSIKSLIVDNINGVLYAGSYGAGFIYRCVLSTGCDTSGDFTIAYNSLEIDITALVIDSANGVLYVGESGSNGNIYRCALATNCDAQGDFTIAYGTAYSYIFSLAIDITNSVLYFGTDSGGVIYRCPTSTSCDAAGDFAIATNTPAQYITSLIVDTTNGVLYAGTFNSGIIYRCVTSTGCDSAGDFTTAIDTPATTVHSLTIDTVNGLLYAGSDNSGIIYRCVLSTACDSVGDFAAVYDTPATYIYSTVIYPGSGILYAGSGTEGIIYGISAPAPLTARGTCWGTSPTPTTNCSAASTTSTGTFTQPRTGLTPGTTYYARAYATNAYGTSYSSDVTFTTLSAPTVTIPTVTLVGTSTATFGGTIVSTSTLTVRGTCYGTNPNPTTNCTSEGGTATGTFSHARVGLIPGTTYYARAYATNANGTGYSADISTTTGASSVSFASAADQSFTFGQADTAISPITVTANAGSLITAANDIRIKIATGTLDMRFDTADVTATVGGGASGKVSGTVSYEGGGSVLVIDVTSDFVTSDAITISGLSYKSFNAARGATTTLALYIGGPADIVSDAVDNKTVAIQGVLVLGDHTLMQVGDRFSQKTENNRELFAFKLTAQGENMNVSSLVISLDPVFGIFTNDVTNVALYKDINSNKAYDGGDVAVGGTGVVSITGGSGTITFSSAFSATGTTNYIMVGSTDLLGGDDGFNPNLITSNITVTGVTSLAAPQILGFVMPAHHTKGGGASGLTGGYIPPQNVTIQTGGSAGGMVGGVPRTSSNGAGGIDPNVGGTTIGNEFGFLRPNSNGTPYSAWTGGANAYNSDGVYATIATDEGQQSYGNFGFVIPSNNQIKGIQVRLEASASAVLGSISAKLSWDGGSSVTTLQDTGLPGTTDTVYNLGGPEDTWGRSWTPAEMNDGNFTLELIGNTEGNTISLDAVQVKVFFQASGGRRGGGGGVGMIESNQYFANVASAVNNVGNFWANLIEKLLGWWE